MHAFYVFQYPGTFSEKRPPRLIVLILLFVLEMVAAGHLKPTLVCFNYFALVFSI